jgi:hypothetical protein
MNNNFIKRRQIPRTQIVYNRVEALAATTI